MSTRVEKGNKLGKVTQGGDIKGLKVRHCRGGFNIFVGKKALADRPYGTPEEAIIDAKWLHGKAPSKYQKRDKNRIKKMKELI